MSAQNFNFAPRISPKWGFHSQILHFLMKILRQKQLLTAQNLGKQLPAMPQVLKSQSGDYEPTD